MAKPTKILSDRSWTDIMTSPKYDGEDKMFPVTQGMAKEFKDIVTGPADVPAKIYGGMVAGVGTLAAPFVDTIGAAGNAALNGYKRLYNYGADLTNRAKLELIDKQIKDFQKKNPNKNALPVGKKFEYKSAAEKAKEAGAATDAEVWAATHEFGYGNDPRTVYRRYRYRKAVNNTPRVSL